MIAIAAFLRFSDRPYFGVSTLRRFHRTRLAGIDIAGLPYVINMTLPDPVENYVHRVGRVGRADCIGLAISIVATAGIKEKVGGGRSMLACLRCASLAGPCPGPNTALCSGRGGFFEAGGRVPPNRY